MSHIARSSNNIDLGHARKSGVHSFFGPKSGVRKAARQRSHKLDRIAGQGELRSELEGLGLDAADYFIMEHDSLHVTRSCGVIELDLDDPDDLPDDDPDDESEFAFLNLGSHFGRDTYGITQCKHFLVSREDDGFSEYDHIEGDAK